MRSISQRFSLGFAVALALIGLPDLLRAAEPPAAPILRIETGAHTAPIRRIATDAAGRYVVTASEDKTARVWDAATGQLLETLRPPQGDNAEGRLYTVAMSPEGELIAAGGITGYQWDKQNSIYIFQRASGKLARRIGGMPNATITNLAWSPDGRYLAAAHVLDGIRVYRTSDFSSVGEDRDYGDVINGVDFDRNGQLVSVCNDGFVRLYRVGDSGLSLVAKKTARGGKQPHSPTFSPDGSRIAVGFDKSTRVDVLSAATLDWLYSPDMAGVTNGNFTSVNWSADGAALYAGGGFNIRGSWKVRRWTEAGRGSYVDLDAARATIMSIAALPQGGIAYGVADSSWGRFDSSGQRTVFVAPQTADFRGNLKEFQISGDAGEVQFTYEVGSVPPARFQIQQQALISGRADSGLIAPRTSAPGLEITDWHNNTEPKLNGNRLKLNRYEMARSVAVAPNAQSFILGTDWHVGIVDRSGNLRGVVVSSVAWAVNVSGDGKTAVAARADHPGAAAGQ